MTTRAYPLRECSQAGNRRHLPHERSGLEGQRPGACRWWVVPQDDGVQLCRSVEGGNNDRAGSVVKSLPPPACCRGGWDDDLDTERAPS